MIEERPGGGNHLPRLAPEARELGQVAQVLLDVLCVFQDEADEIHVLFQRRGFHRLAVLGIGLRARFAQCQQEPRVDIVDLHALEVRFEQRPFLSVVAALSLGDFTDLVGVFDKGLGAGGEGAAVQVLAPARAVAEIEIPVGGNFGRGVEGCFARRFQDELALHVGACVDAGAAVAAL